MKTNMKIKNKKLKMKLILNESKLIFNDYKYLSMKFWTCNCYNIIPYKWVIISKKKHVFIYIESYWVFFFLLLLLLEGIRLLEKGINKEYKKNGAVLGGKNGGDLLMTMKKRAPIRALRKPYSHWLPGIQEDYHGPRSHKSRHH